MSALLEYLSRALITCSWFLQYNSVVFDLIPFQLLKGYPILISAHIYQVSAYSIKQFAEVEAKF